MNDRARVPINRFWISVLALVLAMPVMAIFIPSRAVEGLNPLGIAAVAAYFAVLFVYLWRGYWLWLVLWVAAVALMFTYSDWYEDAMFGGRPNRVLLTSNPKMGPMPEDPVDVYCNGSLVGHTPFEIDIAEALQGIAPATPPQRHEYRVGPTVFAMPATTTEMLGHAPPGPNDQYWWSLDDQGHQGFVRTSTKAVRGAGSPVPTGAERAANDLTRLRPLRDGRLLQISEIANSSSTGLGPPRTMSCERIVFPSIPLHADALVHALVHMNYTPNEAWAAHTRKYLRALFHELNTVAYRDARVMPALRHAVCKEFGITDNMSAKDIDACWQNVLDRVDEMGFFRVDTPEWFAINQLGTRLVPSLDTSFNSELNRREPSAGFEKGIRPTRMRPFGLTPRFVAVFYAVGRLRPEGPRNEIVYLSGTCGEPFRTMLASYQDSYPRDRWGMYFGSTALEILDLPFGENSRSTGLPSEFPAINLNNADRLTPESLQLLLQSVPDIDLAHLILHCEQTGGSPGALYLLAAIPSPAVAARFKNAFAPHPFTLPSASARRGGGRVESRPAGLGGLGVADSFYAFPARQYYAWTKPVFDILADRPNPALDTFLVEALKRAQEGDVASEPTLCSLSQALIMCNAATTREALAKLWNENEPAFQTDSKPPKEISPRIWILDAIASLPRNAAPLAEWTDRIAALSDPSERLAATRALARIDTPEAWQVLEKWASDPDAAVAAAATKQIESERAELQRIQALLAGTLDPNQLVTDEPAEGTSGT